MGNLTENIIDSSQVNNDKNEISVWVDSVFYNPWLEVSVSRDLNNLAGNFSLSFVDKWRESKTDWILQPGKEVLIKIGKQPIITGYIDSLDTDVSKDNRNISVGGRDKTSDLIDCGYLGDAKIRNVTFLSLATQLCKPFGIDVIFEAVPVDEPFDFEYEQGESIFEALHRYGNARSYLLQTNAKSQLVVLNRNENSRIEKSSTDLTFGKNILSIGANFDYSDRFSQYIIKGQYPGSDVLNGNLANNTKGEASDASVDRYRPKVIISNDKTKAKAIQKQAEWEADIRSRESTSVSCTIQGWLKGDGTFWKINELVRVTAGVIGVDQDMLISGVTFGKSVDSGTLTNLTLTTPDAYQTETEKPTGSSPVKRPLGWKSWGAVGTVADVAALFAKRRGE